MLKKLLCLVVILLIAVPFVSAKPKITADMLAKARIGYKIQLVGDAYVGVREGSVFKGHTPVTQPVKFIDKPMKYFAQSSDFLFDVTITPTGGLTIYDMVSNGSARTIWQDPTDANKIHVAMIFSPPGDTWNTFPGRRTKYYYSSDKGTNWTYLVDVPASRSGFAEIDGVSDGRALVVNHSAEGAAGGGTRAQAFIDFGPGIGFFTQLDPLPSGTGTLLPIWPTVVSTASINNPNKFVMVASINSTAYDSAFMNVGTSLTTSSFLGYTFLENGNTAETYDLARGQDGRIGLVYIPSDLTTASDPKCLFYKYSTDGGSTFSTPLKIFQALSGGGDTLHGPLRGVSITYVGNSPKIVFEVCRQAWIGGTYTPSWPAQIRFWSDNLPGSDPNKSIIIADTSNVPYNPNHSTGAVNDVFSLLARPVIGHSTSGNALLVAFQTNSAEYGGNVDTTNFKDIYVLASKNGLNWIAPTRINPTSPRFDWTYPAISDVNDEDANNYYMNMTMLKDAVPGTYVNSQGNGESQASMVYVRVTIPKTAIGVTSISTEIPGSYSLEQNYPNPFNPVTSIRFAVPQTSQISLYIYNLNGQIVRKLVDNELVVAGIKEVKMDASNLASGIYFYTMTSGSYKETKKMMLIK